MAELNRVEKMQLARKKRIEAGIPNKPTEHNLIKRYGLNSKSRKEAIFMMCFHCQGGDADVMPDPVLWRHGMPASQVETVPKTIKRFNGFILLITR